MGDAFDDFDLDEVVGQQAQGPARRTFGRLGTGELGDAGLDLAGDLDFSRPASREARRPVPDGAGFATALAETQHAA